MIDLTNLAPDVIVSIAKYLDLHSLLALTETSSNIKKTTENVESIWRLFNAGSRSQYLQSHNSKIINTVALKLADKNQSLSVMLFNAENNNPDMKKLFEQLKNSPDKYRPGSFGYREACPCCQIGYKWNNLTFELQIINPTYLENHYGSYANFKKYDVVIANVNNPEQARKFRNKMRKYEVDNVLQLFICAEESKENFPIQYLTMVYYSKSDPAKNFWEDLVKKINELSGIMNKNQINVAPQRLG